MIKTAANLLKMLSIWVIILTLSHVSYAQTLSLSIDHAPLANKSNQRVIQFIAEFNKAKIVRDLIPSIDKYLESDSDRIFLKENLRAHMLLEAPELQIQGDLITLIFESHKKTLEMRLNLTNMKLYVKGKVINLAGMTAEKLVQKLSELNLVASQSSFSIINEAHAALVLGILAVAGIGALVVGILALLSSWSKKSCFERFEATYRTLETAELNCLNDKIMVSENPQTKSGSETHHYLTMMKQKMKGQRKSKLSCKKEVSNHFKYFSFYRKKSCLQSKTPGLICEKINSLESCLQEFKALDANVISQERIRVKTPIKKTKNRESRNNREQ